MWRWFVLIFMLFSREPAPRLNLRLWSSCYSSPPALRNSRSSDLRATEGWWKELLGFRNARYMPVHRRKRLSVKSVIKPAYQVVKGKEARKIFAIRQWVTEECVYTNKTNRRGRWQSFRRNVCKQSKSTGRLPSAPTRIYLKSREAEDTSTVRIVGDNGNRPVG